MVFFTSLYTFSTFQGTEKPLGWGWGGREGGREGKKEGRRRRKDMTDTLYSLPWLFTSHAVDSRSRSSWGKNDANSDVTTSGLQPESFHSVRGGWPDFSFGQTLRLLHAELSLTTSEVLRTLTDSFTVWLLRSSHSSFPGQLWGEGSKVIGQRPIERRPIGDFWSQNWNYL